jgi:phosphatidylglycerophosphatase A
MTTLESGQSALVNRPDSRFMLSHPAHLIALGFGSGLSRLVPGTVGTLFAWLSFNVLSSRWPGVFDMAAWGAIIGIGFVLGIWACEKTGRDMGISDHGGMVWDEIIAFWLVLLVLAPAPASTQFWAFLWFRLFDMVKPPPIAWFDRHVKGGLGVMWDDIVAAFYTLLLFALWRVT